MNKIFTLLLVFLLFQNMPIFANNMLITIVEIEDYNPIDSTKTPQIQNFSIVTANTDPTVTTPMNTPAYNMNILANDDINGIPITSANVNISITNQPANGLISINTDGTLNYFPNNNYIGLDCYTYQICDKLSPNTCSQATNCINVKSSTGPSITAYPDNYITLIGIAVSNPVLSNDFVNGLAATTSNVTLSIYSNPSFGTATVSNGIITYTPNASYVGIDTYNYVICSISSPNSCSYGTVTITVGCVPIIANTELINSTGAAVITSVLSNDIYNNASATINNVNLSVVTQALHGQAIVNSNGTISYTPNSGYTGSDSYTYKICDKNASTCCSQVTDNISVTSVLPTVIAVSDNATTLYNSCKTINVLANDTYNGGAATTSLVNITITSQGTNGTVTLNSDGTINYCPKINYLGTDYYTYQICSVAFPGVCSSVTNEITIVNSNKIKLDAKVWLQGALYGVSGTTGVMRDDLRSKNLIPNTSPYPNLGYIPLTYNGNLATSVLSVTGNNAIVDWVWIELRNSLTNVVDSRSALLQRDGDIVDIDGISLVTFDIAQAGNYYVIVKHRNHLGVMTKNPVSLSSTAFVVDFRLTSTLSYTLASNAANVPLVSVTQGLALWAGNTFYDKSVIFQGSTNDVNPVYQQIVYGNGNIFVTPNFIVKSYNNNDVNLDGEVIFQGTGNEPNFIYQNVLSNNPGNALKLNYYIIKEQLP